MYLEVTVVRAFGCWMLSRGYSLVSAKGIVLFLQEEDWW